MLDIINENFKIDITYSNNKSRPSKTLIDPELYLQFSICKFDPYIKLKEYTLKECISKNFDNFTIDQKNITINDANYKLIENKEYFCDIINEITVLNCIIELTNIYTYTQIQFILILKTFFENVFIITSSYKNCVYILCKGKKSDKIGIKRKYVKDFNIIIPKYLVDYIKNYNTDYFKKIIKINKIIDNSDLTDITPNIELLNNYYMSFIKKDFKKDCKCKDIEYNIFNKLYICKNCYSLHKIDHFLVLDHSSAASLKTVL